ncbi:MAG: Appr-1-p processing protein [Clostridia bacterium]|nr:Appr-1-p processing protein [Clostridia bacterium]
MKHIKGNIFESNADVILHQVNCQGVMGSGVAKQVRERYPIVYDYYKSWCDNDEYNPKHFPTSPLLGMIQIVYIDDNVVGDTNNSNRVIVNMFSQDKFGYDGKCYTNYDALKRCLENVNIQFKGYTVAIPYGLGCVRGGGDWNVVSKMIETSLKDCDVTLYEYDGG